MYHIVFQEVKTNERKLDWDFQYFYFLGKNSFGEKERSYIEGSEILGISFQGVDDMKKCGDLCGIDGVSEVVSVWLCKWWDNHAFKYYP